MIRFAWLLVLAFLLFSIPLSAQLQQETNTIHHESLRQGINTISAGQGIDFRRRLKNGSYAVIRTGQFSIYNRALRENPFITNNLWNEFRLKKRAGKFLDWDNAIEHQSFFANKTRIARILSGLIFQQPFLQNSVLQISARGGLLNDKRVQFDNSGWTAEAGADLAGHSADSGITYFLRGNLAQSRPGPRKNTRILAEGGAAQSFEGGGLMEISGVYLQHQVEDYLQKDIQSIKSDTLLGRFRIRIPLGKSFSFQSNNVYLTPNRSFFYLKPEDRSEIRNVRYFQDEYQSLSSLMLRSGRLQLTASFESALRNRSYDIINRLDAADPLYQQQLNALNLRLNEERIKDIREQYSTYVLEGRWQMTSRHSLRGSFTGHLLRVDTRSELNNQDRDELLYAGELTHDWKLRFGFRLSNRISGSYRHLIFIKESQSAENYIDRIIRWEPSLRWNGKNLSWVGSMGIWATYQVRDFAAQQDKNRSNRVLLFQHQIDYRTGSRSGIVAEILRRENRLSQLNWNRFSESPIDTVVVSDLALRYRLVYRGVALQGGYRAFWQLRKSRASMPDPGQGASLIFLKSYFVQQGPQLRMEKDAGRRLRLQGELWLQWTSQFFRFSKSNLPYFGSPVTAEQLAVRERRVLPFFSLRLIWKLQ